MGSTIPLKNYIYIEIVIIKLSIKIYLTNEIRFFKSLFSVPINKRIKYVDLELCDFDDNCVALRSFASKQTLYFKWFLKTVT